MLKNILNSLLVEETTSNKSTSSLIKEQKKPKIKIIYIGSGACNILESIYSDNTKNTNFDSENIISYAISSDSSNIRKLYGKVNTWTLGYDLLYGNGAGCNFKNGEQAAINDTKKISEIISNCDLCVIVSCLGKGTGSGATPVIAKIAQEQERKTIAILTMPNKIEGTIICQNAKKSLEEIDTYVDSLCVINDIENASTNNKDEKKSLFEATNTTIKNLIHTLSEFVIVSDYRKSNFADLVNFINNNKYFSFFYFNNENIEEKVLKNKDLFSNEKTSNATNILVDFEFSRDENQILIFDQFKNFFCNNFRNIATLIKKITVTSFEEKKYIGIFYSINNLQLENNLDNGTIINLQQNVDNKRISCVDFDINSKNCIEEFIEKNKLKKNTIKIDDFFKAENNK